MQCSNNFKQILLGLHNYHDTYKVFPNGEMGTNPAGCGWNTNSGTCDNAGPIYMILPFIEQKPLWDTIWSPLVAGGVTYPPGGPWVNWGDYPPYDVHIKGTKCPSDGFAAGRHPWGNSCNSYCFSRGDKIENAHVSNRAIAGWGSNWVPRGLFTGNGWGNNTGSNNGINSITDGTSNTVAVSEMAVFNGNTRDVKGSYCAPVGNLQNNPSQVLAFKGPGGVLNCPGGNPASTHGAVDRVGRREC